MPDLLLEQKDTSIQPAACRCGGLPTKPVMVFGCKHRWMIRCSVELCDAMIIGQGYDDTVNGWNHLAQHLFR
ncbi:hypothetical protein OE749_05230 [Aestuariibacter sp. AA17]|uniref:Uncharacterized protein n=1 Tax=Fluctibacter corallii TaxID=2984329 RepID=A0ABT3A630_9ALTE|nr:hypothetical protein [Aestuariibacter sp. AA17]MCV2884090.1 hypothetical protein [Aestuariibacter sp. AA17]